MKNYDLIQDRFLIYNAVINIPLKKNTFIIFDYIFNREYINIPLVINLKTDNVLEKDFNIHLKEYNKIRHVFKLDYNFRADEGNNSVFESFSILSVLVFIEVFAIIFCLLFLDYNITKINFYLYLSNNEIYNDEKIEYLKNILFNNKKIKFNDRR